MFLLYFDNISFLQDGQALSLLACLDLHGHGGGQLHVGDIHMWPRECINNLPAKHRVAEWFHFYVSSGYLHQS